MTTERHPPRPESDRLDSWKAIAAFLGRDERTVQRWEKERQLPVRRVPGERGGVFAYRRELLRWLDADSEMRSLTETLQPGSDTVTSRPMSSAPLPPVGVGDEAEKGAGPAAAPKLAFFPGEAVLQSAALVSNMAAQPPVPERATSSPPAAPLPRKWTWDWRSGSVLLAVVLLFAGLVYAGARYRKNSGLGRADAAPTGPGVVDLRSVTPQNTAKASELYQRGKRFWAQRTPASLNQALDSFTQAIVQDPNFGEAFTGLAETYELMPQFGSMPAQEAFPRALVAAQRAVALNPKSADAHRVLAFVQFYWQWREQVAFQEFQQAILLRPDDPEAHHWFADALLLIHRDDEAAAEIARAHELDPTSRAIMANQILIQSSAGMNPQECLRRLRDLENEEPDLLSPFFYTAQILVDRTTNFGAYGAQLKRIAAQTHSPVDLLISRTAESGLRSGGAAGMFQALEQVESNLNAKGQFSAFEVGRACLRARDIPQAVQFFRKAFQEQDFRLIGLAAAVQPHELQESPDYQELRQKILDKLKS